MTLHHVRSRARKAAAAAVATILATITTLTTEGCGLTTDPYNPTTDEQAAEPARILPTLEDTETQLRAAIEHLGEQAAAIAPNLKFHWHHEPSYSGCPPPFDKTDGRDLRVPHYVSDTSIPGQSWAAILAIVEQTAVKLGLAGVQVFHDQPDHHDMVFYNETGTSLRFGSQVSTVITGNTGCRLPRTKMPHPDSSS